MLASEETCFDSINASFASDYMFNAPYDGIIEGMVLFYEDSALSVGVTCALANPLNYWGCIPNWLMVTLQNVTNKTTATGSVLFPTSDGYNNISITAGNCAECNIHYYIMDDYDSYADPLIVQSRNTRYTVTTDDVFSLQMCEAACKTTGGDNNGTTCASVYFIYSEICMFCICQTK